MLGVLGPAPAALLWAALIKHLPTGPPLEIKIKNGLNQKKIRRGTCSASSWLSCMPRLELGFSSGVDFIVEKQLQRTNENTNSFQLVLSNSTNLQLLLFLKGILIIGLR